MCLTIIGIPLGLASFKLIPVSLTTFGRGIVDIERPGVSATHPASGCPPTPHARS